MSGRATRIWDAEQQVPYLVYEDQWISYEDQDSLALKVSSGLDIHLY